MPARIDRPRRNGNGQGRRRRRSGPPLGTRLTDTARIATGAADPDPSNDAAELASVVAAANDLAVTVTPEQVAVPPGTVVGYRVVVTNNGPQVASELR